MRSSSRKYYERKKIDRPRSRSMTRNRRSDSDRDSEKEAKKANDGEREKEKRKKKKQYSSMSSNPTEDERKPVCYVSEPTAWTVPDTEVTDPVYVRESESSTSFVPLPQAETDSRPSTDPRIEEHFIGVRTREEAGAIVKPDDFVLYYRKEDDNELEVTIPLYLAHRNTRNKLFHFPVVRYTEDNGSKWWYVQIGNHKTRSVRLPQFRQLSDLVRCYHLYRFTDARTGRMEVFPLWKDGIDDY